ncbi:MAG: class I SAM-dependent methyltransferase [Lachnospiraceae bacterium]
MGNTTQFETIAGTYDTPERAQIAKIFAAVIREYLVGEKNKRVIDFGCGTGLVGMELLNDVQSMLFLDTAPNMLRKVEEKIAASHSKNAETLCFDFEKDSSSDLHADYIFMVQVLLHIKEYEPVLRKLYQVLNPGGHLLIIDFDKNEKVVSDLVHPGFDQAELTDTMSKAGYRNIQSKTFFSGSSLFMGKDASLFVLDSQKQIS